MSHLVLTSLLLVALILIARLSYKIFTYRWTTQSSLRSVASGVVISSLTLAMTCAVLEILLHVFLVRTDFFGFTYAAARWWDTYWQPVNSYAYRDIEHTPESVIDKNVMFVIGDSIVAGQGIDDVSDRFSNKLSQALGESWVVMNIARCGWNTSHEIYAFQEALKIYTPKAVVLSYYSNDVEGALLRHKISTRPSISPPRGIVGDIVNNSALINFVYWRVFQLSRPDLGSDYWEKMRTSWSKEEVKLDHLNELKTLFDLASDFKAERYAVLVPALPAIGTDDFILDPVRDVLVKEGVKVLDLRKELQTWPEEDLVVSSHDHHPSVAVNDFIAESLATLMRKTSK